MERLTVFLGRGGTWRTDYPDFDAELRGRVQVDAEGRVSITELHIIPKPGPVLTGEVVRSIPFAQIEAALNVPLVAMLIPGRLSGGDDLGDAWDVPVDASSPSDWPHQMPPPPPQPTVPSVTVDRLSNGVFAVTLTPALLTIEVPDERRRPDEFYRHVAEVFSLAASMGPRPAVRIADASGVPVSTVHRWVKEARRRGLMSPARTNSEQEGPQR